jgi:hypothetical protein
MRSTRRRLRARVATAFKILRDAPASLPRMTVTSAATGERTTGPTMANHPDDERELSVHILSVSAQLVGVCLTVIGLFRVIVRLRAVDSIADNLLAVDALAFLLACVFAYGSLRAREPAARRRRERAADACFGAALALMAVICALVAWELV